MATLAREILTLTGMECRIFCAGMSFVGISVTGTWAGTLYFEGFQNTFGLTGPTGGAVPKPTGVYPWATAGTLPADAVASATANGSWYWPVQNYDTFRVRFERTSGSPQIRLAASIDSSWADAFLTASQRFVNNTANGAVNTLLIPADTNLGKRVKSLVVSAAPSSAAGGGSSTGPSTAVWSQNPVLRINDQDTRLLGLDFTTTLPFQYTVPLPADGIACTPGNPLTIQMARGGAAVITNINAEIGYY